MRPEGTVPPVVLLVKAPQDDRDMYAAYLRRHGFRVLTADTVEEAVAQAPGTDVVVTGVRVPGGFSGVDLVRRLTTDGATRGIPVLVLSASVERQEHDAAVEAGCTAFLGKPCAPDRLLRALRAAVQGEAIPDECTPWRADGPGEKQHRTGR